MIIKKFNKIDFIVISILVFTIISLSGCASIEKKFTRRTKEKEVRPSAYVEKDFVKQYSNEHYYKNHFTFWHSWHSELINYVGKNAKRERRSASEALRHLEEMKSYLNDESKAMLQKEIDYLKKAADKLEHVTGKAEEGRLRRDLERIMRHINSNFYYSKVKDSIITEEINLSS